MEKQNVKEFLVRMDSGTTYIITAEDAEKFRKKRNTVGRQFPVYKLENGSEIAMNKVEALEVYKLADNDTKKPKVSEVEPEPIKDDQEKKPIEQTRKEKEAEFIAKTACTHKDVSLHFQNTKKGTRYFPVCDFCGHRGRYIGNDTLTEEEIKTAKEWIER